MRLGHERTFWYDDVGSDGIAVVLELLHEGFGEVDLGFFEYIYSLA